MAQMDLKDYAIWGSVFLGIFVFVIALLQQFGIAEKIKAGWIFYLFGVAIAIWATFTLLQRKYSLSKLDYLTVIIAYAVAVFLLWGIKYFLPSTLFATLLP